MEQIHVDFYHKSCADISYGGGVMDRWMVRVLTLYEGETDRGSEWEADFDPLEIKWVSSNEALSRCAEGTVGPPQEQDDLEDHKAVKVFINLKLHLWLFTHPTGKNISVTKTTMVQSISTVLQ